MGFTIVATAKIETFTGYLFTIEQKQEEISEHLVTLFSLWYQDPGRSQRVDV